MSANLHLQMTPAEIKESNEYFKDFTKRRIAKRIDQKKEASKPYGANPMQAAAKRAAKNKKKVRNRPEVSRLTQEEVVNAYVNID